jgi:hypothetical protein
MLFYRAGLCSACKVKLGLGKCEKCEAARKDLAEIEREFLKERKEREDREPRIDAG